MFDIGYLYTLAQQAAEADALIKARWDKLTAEQKAEELRLREVKALEKLADAAERESRKTCCCHR